MGNCLQTRAIRNSGVSLLFTLLALVALTLAAVALVRSTDTGALVLGNLTLKQDATAVSDQAANAAIEWLVANPGALNANSPDNGYYASANEDVDVTGQQVPNDGSARSLVIWDGDNCAYANGIANANCKLQPSAERTLGGNTYRYVILRLCDLVGDPDLNGNSCARPLNDGEKKSSSNGLLDYNANLKHSVGGAGEYYRIVVRVVGPRATTSYVETIVHL